MQWLDHPSTLKKSYISSCQPLLDIFEKLVYAPFFKKIFIFLTFFLDKKHYDHIRKSNLISGGSACYFFDLKASLDAQVILLLKKFPM